MKKALLMAALAAAVVGLFGYCGNSGSGARTWYCGAEEKPRAVKATLKDGTLTVRGKGEMMDYSDTRIIGEPWSKKPDAEAIKEYQIDAWPPWYYAVVYDSTVSITDVVIGEGVTYIGDWAFGWLPELKSITIPASVSSIGDGALGGCGVDCEMVQSDTCVSRPLSITVAADNPHYSFEDGILFNKNKTTLIQYLKGGQQDTDTIPNGVETIGDRAFARCDGLTSITIPDGVKTIGVEAFQSCAGLTSITIPNSVTSIGRGAFSWCEGLTSITISDGVKTIGVEAFQLCASLTSITIPNSVTSIGRGAFERCYKLKSITVQNPTPPKLGVSALTEINRAVCLYVPKGSIDAYRAADGWNKIECIKDIESVPE